METVEEILIQYQTILSLENDGFVMYEFNITHLNYYLTSEKTKSVLGFGINKEFRGGDGPSLDYAVRYSGFSAGVYHEAVENLLIPLVEKHLSMNYGELKITHTIPFNLTTGNFLAAWEAMNTFAAIDLRNNLSTLQELAEMFRKQITLHIEPFWRQYADLQFINNEIIDKVHDDDLGNYLGGMAPFKKLIIMKLCNNAGYDGFSESYQSRIAKAVIEQGRDEYVPYLNLVNELMVSLDSI
ncbi:hypothetical protein [Spirosoma sordidisoli]|uniref:Uncharacterized protein n=1 Tax=Spirosoma sordidisoli TaxID=2502893 RepID=A0A4Q2UG01_9BACT|nr:hypothetical protein [Spirosoma sordidisoli]RYC68217.1 hypothetical protein EQG79_22480 [Spirosoma sordidisoli]